MHHELRNSWRSVTTIVHRLSSQQPSTMAKEKHYIYFNENFGKCQHPLFIIIILQNETWHFEAQER